ncbi:helix-hairpin-helix domain-containing protein [[Clostridium] polysaccharolyticum]|uniref:Competence protein ComEA n=1 Tax=[Clostridium] polysaccharolyticum TaxID=29364 RepID=A0A1I0EK16_9FIRM|nr:helix-hairpin-helix domain-containing protein [[Clostridium] polysaccharolyticum]SET45798.1 competence protein ComEA [[Clostridium] polysaccharolyticum]
MKRERKTSVLSEVLPAKKGLILMAACILCLAFWYGSKGNSKNIQETLTLDEAVAVTMQAPQVSDKDRAGNAGKKYFSYVCGAVKNPGVYEFKEGARILDLIESAGGFTRHADDTYLNLALAVSDSDKIYVPTKQETREALRNGTDGEKLLDSREDDASDKVNINTADIDKLTSLPGIGEAKAKSIISYREEQGTFQAIEELKNVEGIKDGVYQKIKDLISI